MFNMYFTWSVHNLTLHQKVDIKHTANNITVRKYKYYLEITNI